MPQTDSFSFNPAAGHYAMNNISGTGLREKAVTATWWSLLDAVGGRLVQIAIGVVLARLLMPEQFGLVGMLTIFMGISQALLSSGFGAALIQKRDMTQADTSSVFYYNIAVGILLTCLLFLFSPRIAEFYRQPILVPLTRAMSFVVLINSTIVVQTTLLIRKVDFKVQTKISLFAGPIAGLIGVGLAFGGFGVWSLVAQQVSEALIRAVLLWIVNGWRPDLLLDFHSLRQLLGFGSRMLGSSLLEQVFSKIYFSVIGKLFSPASVGFYARASALVEVPSAMLSTIANRITFPVFSAVQGENAALIRGIREARTLIALVNTPVMIGLAFIARPLVKVVLTERWLPCVPYMQLLTLVGMLFPLEALNYNILMAKGRADWLLRIELAKKALGAIAIVVAWRWGIMALLWARAVLAVVAFSLSTVYADKLLRCRPFIELRAIIVYLLLSAVMGGLVFLVGIIRFQNDPLRLLVQFLTGLGVYSMLCVLVRPPAYLAAVRMMRQRLPWLDR